MRPNLHREMIQNHMNGLRESIQRAINGKSSFEQRRLLRKGVYAISSLLGGRGIKTEDIYNGFKDELTDYTKPKKKGLGLSW